MTDKQTAAALDSVASWLDKASVGCLLIGMFEPEHIFGGLIGSVVCFLAAGALKIWSAK